MANLELDPLFVKALALLRSKNKDSTDLLKGLLDDVLGKATGKFSSKPASPKVVTSAKSDKSEAAAKRAPVKRSVEKSSFGAALSSADHGVAAKKSKVDEEVVRPSRIQPRRPLIDDDEDDSDHDVDDDDDDTEDEPVEDKDEKREQDIEEEEEGKFAEEDEKPGSGDAEEMWLDLACVVCKEMGISAGNQLVECQECHNLYHQRCHSPPVTNSDPNDPRQVWYCAKCKSNMKKLASKKPSSLPESLITTGSSSSSSSSSSYSSSTSRDQDKDSLNLFRRMDPKPSPTSTTSKQMPFGGLANYAANLTGRQHTSSSSSSSSATTSSKANPTGVSRILTGSGGHKVVPSSITGRSFSSSGASTAMSGRGTKSGGLQRSTSVTPSGSSTSSTSSSSTSSSSSSSSSTSSSSSSALSSGKGAGSTVPMSGSTVGGGNKALPQISTASAMKRLHMMKKKALKR